MSYEAIRKSKEKLPPNLENYEQYCSAFSREAARRGLEGLLDGKGNIAHEAVARHSAGAKAGHTAMRFLRKNGETFYCSYARLRELTNKFANILKNPGVRKDERVYSLLGHVRKKLGAVVAPKEIELFLNLPRAAEKLCAVF